MKEVVIVAAARTAIGDFGGALKGLEAHDLGKIIIREVVARAGINPSDLDKVIFGVTMNPREPNVGRNAAFLAGIPEDVPGISVNAACCSSAQAVISGVQAIQCGECEVVLVGGVESMSNAPYIMPSARWGQRLRSTEVVDMLWEGMQNPLIGVGMGLTAENLADKYGISPRGAGQVSVTEPTAGRGGYSGRCV